MALGLRRRGTTRSTMRVLLVEPAYRNKYPPLGLMKIAAFHKMRGDYVHLVKGCDKNAASMTWDRVYLTTLFSFYWTETIKTIRFYEFCTKEPKGLFIGGPMATIMDEEIEKETGFKPVRGLLNESGKIGLPYDECVDCVVPDYSLLNEIEYRYPASNAYFAYATRGCIRKCPFCAVPILEPHFIDYIPLKEQIRAINDKYGEKKDLLLLDNNILASHKFAEIIDEIKEAGFTKGAKSHGSTRFVDFNQGIDLRLLTRDKMKRLADLPIRPLRIAFDHIALRERYIEKVELAAEFGIIHLSNYVLYNYRDTPDDFYQRLKTNIELNERLGTRIFSFPMRYIPIKDRDRRYVGKHWSAKYLRGIQCILNATHGVVSPKRPFFEAAFGRNVREFNKLLLMPDKYIIYRHEYRSNGAARWNLQYKSLTPRQKVEFKSIVHDNNFQRSISSECPKIEKLLVHYHKGKTNAKKQLELY